MCKTLRFDSGNPHQIELFQVMVPESEYKRQSSRQSMVLFVHPDNHVMVQPLPGINGDPKYEPVNAHDYVMSRFQATYS
jgi:hypothetical protein